MTDYTATANPLPPYPTCDPCCPGPHTDCLADYQHFLLLAESESESEWESDDAESDDAESDDDGRG